ncbi:TolC family outer membrane protein [Sphingomonadaceae bacterium]|nr:TolC family outer membrane protein [Sphingomonadaceae bacterium]
MNARAALFAGAAGLLALAPVIPASAETLEEALIKAYNSNPSLQGARANQRATDETVPIEKAAGRPDLRADATHIEFVKTSPNSFTAPRRTLQIGSDLTVPIYSGGAVRNAVRSAEVRVEAGQADLRATESAIFSQVVAAYMDVIRGEALVALSRNQVEVLGVNLQASRDRFEIGDLTRTDIAQSQSRLAVAQGDLQTAEANLIGARETYIQLVGNAPGILEAPPPLPNLPESASSAVATALESNPDLIAARERAEAAGIDIDVAGASRLPTVGLFAGANYSNFFGTLGGPTANNFSQSETTANAGIQISIPIFQGGRPAALQRQAQALASASFENVIAAERSVIAQTRAAFSSWTAANAIIESSQVAVSAAELSLEGVRAENTVGNRTVLDILDAERELLSTRTDLVTARRNAYVAGFNLLAAMGLAEARDLGLGDGTPLYDPQTNYERVEGAWWDWQRDPDPVPVSTRTIDTPAQNAAIPASDVVNGESPASN